MHRGNWAWPLAAGILASLAASALFVAPWLPWVVDTVALLGASLVLMALASLYHTVRLMQDARSTTRLERAWRRQGHAQQDLSRRVRRAERDVEDHNISMAQSHDVSRALEHRLLWLEDWAIDFVTPHLEHPDKMMQPLMDRIHLRILREAPWRPAADALEHRLQQAYGRGRRPGLRAEFACMQEDIDEQLRQLERRLESLSSDLDARTTRRQESLLTV